MAFVSFTESLSVGVGILDHQHTVLFETIDALYTAVRNGEPRALVGGLLHKMAEETHQHFLAEEAVMEAVHYPQLKAHRLRHCSLTTEVDEYVARFDRSTIPIDNYLLDFLVDWFTTHIRLVDQIYAPWMNMCGVR